MIKLDKTKVLRDEPLGEGAFGTVFAYGKNMEEAKWALKIQLAKNLDALLLIMQEIVLGFSCNHSSILPIIGYFIEPNPTTVGWYVYIKLPRQKQNLKKLIKSVKDPANNKIPKEDIIQYLYTLTSALIYLHDRRIAHRDIKPDNILVDDEGKVKLTDIGAATFFAEGDPSLAMDIGGTPFYMSPEACLGEEKLTRKDLYKGDIWSLGIVTAELCLLKPKNIFSQYPIDKKQNLVNENLENVEKRYDKQFADVIRQMLKFDRNERISAYDLQRLIKDTYPEVIESLDKNFDEFNPSEMKASQHVIKYFSETKDQAKKELEKKWKGWFQFESTKSFEIRPNKNPWLTEQVISDCMYDLTNTLKEHNINDVKDLSLNFARCQQLTEQGIGQLADQIAGNLRGLQQLSLNLTECVQISTSGFDRLTSKIGQNLSSLKDLTLNFSECKQFSDETLNSLSCHIEDNLPQLERLSLNLSGCGQITDLGIMTLPINTVQKMKQIKQLSLNLFGCYQISDEGRATLRQFVQNQAENLEDLSLDFCWRELAGDDDVRDLTNSICELKKMRSLSLNFKGCAQLTHKGVKEIMTNLRKLDRLENLSLSFEWCTELSDQAKEHIGSFLQEKQSKIQKLSLKFDECLQIQSFLPLYTILGSLSRLQELALSFESLLNYTDNEMERLGSSLKNNIQKLSLSFAGCEKVTDYGASSLLKQLTSLTTLSDLSLSFRNCKKIDDQGAAEIGLHIGRDIKELRSLSINFSRSNLSVEGVRNMCNYIGQYPKKLTNLYLNFEGCQQIKQDVAWALFGLKAKNFKELKQVLVDFRNCPNVKIEDRVSMTQGLSFASQVIIL